MVNFQAALRRSKQRGALEPKDDTFIIDRSTSSADCILLFGNMKFPIIDITEEQMVELIHQWDCEDIMKNIWFCHNPINNKPCGFCRPCQQKMESKMEWLLPKDAQNRYYRFKRLTNIFGDRLGNKLASFMR